MVYSYPAKSLVVLFLLSFAKSQFTAYCDWFLTADTGAATVTSFPNQKNGGVPAVSPSDGADLRSSVHCNSITMNQETRKLEAEFLSVSTDSQQTAYGFWVNFESTIGNEFFIFGDPSSLSFRVSSSTEGSLLLQAYSDASTTDPSNDFSVTVPMGNFHIDKWIFLVFHFEDGGMGSVMLKILVPGQEEHTKATTAGYFSKPINVLSFGNDIKASFYEVVVGKNGGLGVNLLSVTLYDASSSGIFVIPCAAGSCTDDQCTSDGKCVAKKQLCSICSGVSCTACSDAGLDPATYCSSCLAGNTLKNGKCNFYLGCADANNCGTCSTSSNICDSCPANYFLYKESASSTSCISCADSCTNCVPGPNCYECAESIVQSGSNCEIEQIGFQISFDTPNIVLDFAYPLSTALTKDSFTANSNAGTPITTTTWTFTGCIAGSVQCKIGTDLKETDLPIAVNIEFDQA